MQDFPGRKDHRLWPQWIVQLCYLYLLLRSLLDQAGADRSRPLPVSWSDRCLLPAAAPAALVALVGGGSLGTTLQLQLANPRPPHSLAAVKHMDHK